MRILNNIKIINIEIELPKSLEWKKEAIIQLLKKEGIKCRQISEYIK